MNGLSLDIKLQVFEGPLDLLLHLLDEAKVEIEQIPIHEITDQYMAYLQAMQELELDIASDFLVMAATLLQMKSRSLLPKPPVEEWQDDEWDGGLDPRDELIQRLIEYKKYKEAVEWLRTMQHERSQIFIKEPDDLTPFAPVVVDEPLRGIEIKHLMNAFQRVLQRTKKGEQVAKIQRDELSVKDRIREIRETLRRRREPLLFRSLFPDCCTKELLVVTFLALLELMKIKQIRCYQHQLFDEIVIHPYPEEADGQVEFNDSTIEVDY